jgi:hypothetical protein
VEIILNELIASKSTTKANENQDEEVYDNAMVLGRHATRRNFVKAEGTKDCD